IADLSRLDGTGAEPALPYVACLLEDPHGCSVVGEREGENAQQVQWLEGVRRNGAYGCRHDPATPVRAADPVTDLRRAPFDVGAGTQADPAGRIITDHDGKAQRRRLRDDRLDVGVRVGGTVGVRKPIAQ